jgi:glycosyltransferase involved in cell wall biosynthesis
MNRSVLIVTPFFAPQNHAAMFRAYKLAKYLPQYGWKPIVLTVDKQYLYNEDPNLLPALPLEVEVVCAGYIEPTLRGLRMALGGQDRTFQAIKQVAAPDSLSVTRPRTRATRAYEYAVANWLHVPDAYWTWARTAVAAGRKIIRDRGIEVVYTSSAPYSSLAVGRDLQKCGVHWVADFRDPLGYLQKPANCVPRVYVNQHRVVKDALIKADAVTVLASSYCSIFRDVYGSEHADPIFIPTGIDEELLELPKPGGTRPGPYLVFAGEYLPEYDTSFWEAFSKATRNQEIAKIDVKLLVIGTLEINRKRLAPLVDKFGLHHQIQFLDQMPQGDVYGLLRGACAGILIPGTRAFWWTSFAKMTDYIGMRKPVLALVPDPSEARTALTRSGLGIFLDGSLENRTRILTDFLLGKYPLPAPDQDECERYTARHQVQSFAKLFDSLATRPRTANEKRRK